MTFNTTGAQAGAIPDDDALLEEMLSDSPKTLEPDRHQLAAFIGALFRYADVGTFVSLRSFTDEGGSRPAGNCAVDIRDDGHGRLIHNAVVHARKAAQAKTRLVFSPPICTFTNEDHAREIDVANGLVLTVECDSTPVQSLATLKAVLDVPTIIMESGGRWTDPATGEVSAKVHLHWRLTVPTRTAEDHAKLKRARRIAKTLVGADGTAYPLVHPLRWAGSWHRKGEPRLARIVGGDVAAEIDLDDALQRLEAAAAAAGFSTNWTDAKPKADAGPLDMDAINSVAEWADLPEDLSQRFDAAKAGDDYLARVWAGNKPPTKRDGSAADISYSGHLMSIANAMKGRGFTGDEFGMVMRTWTAMASTHDGDDMGRQIQRAWENAPAVPPTSAEEDFPHVETNDVDPPDHDADPDDDADAADPAASGKPLILDHAAPLVSARAYIGRRHTIDGVRTIHHQDGQWRMWTGSHYPTVDDAAVRSQLYTFLDAAKVRDPKDPEARLLPFNPSQAKVSNVTDALKAVANLPNSGTMPSWLDKSRASIPASEILVCSNGLLRLKSLELRPHDPAFYGANALEFPFDPSAQAPTKFLAFLNDIFADDAEAIATLQDLFGLYLSADTSHQKIALIVGPKRSGKGTLARLLTALLGPDNVRSPTLASLAGEYGLWPLIGKPLAIISDARLSAKTDTAVIAERLLSVSGEDSATINRKNLTFWSGRLPTRFLIFTNELPKLVDASGALASRFIVLQLKQSFLGREDHGLTDRLLPELPGILNWAITGWQRLQSRGYLVQPKSAAETVEALENLASPINAFIRAECETGPTESVDTDALFDAWRAWRHDQGWDQSGTKQVFARDLHSAFPDVTTVQYREGLKRRRKFCGVGLPPREDDFPQA